MQGYKRTQKRVGFTRAPHVTYRRHDEYRRERERKRGTTGNAGCRNWRSCDLYAPLPIAQRVANDSPCGYEWRTDNNGKGGILKQLIQRIIKGKNSLKGNMTKLRAPPPREKYAVRVEVTRGGSAVDDISFGGGEGEGVVLRWTNRWIIKENNYVNKHDKEL